MKSLRYKNQDVKRVLDMSNSLGKLPPQAIDIEEAVLAAIMLERNALNDVIDVLRPDDFYLETHKIIYQAVVDLYNNDQPVDMRTVVQKLRQNGKIELVGGAYQIAEITSKVSSAANIEYHSRILVEMKIKRDVIMEASDMHQKAYEDTTDALELLDGAQKALDAIGGKYLKGNFQSAGDIADVVMKKITDNQGKDSVTGITTGLKLLDKVTGGWQDTNLIIVAGRPGMGKTAFLLSVAENAAKAGIPIGIFSLEMAGQELVTRSFSGIGEIENTKIFKNLINDDELFKLQEAREAIKKLPLFIDDTPAISTLEFRARSRRLVHDHGVKAIFVDYLQLMKDPDASNREQEIASISQTCKRVSKELKVPVIAMCQLSRAVETRGSHKRPQLSDLRESGSIEQDADMVIFLYRPEYYQILKDDQGNSTVGILEAIIAKHRNGSLDTVPLRYIGKYTKVEDLTLPGVSVQGALPLAMDYSKPLEKQKDELSEDLPF